MVKSFSMDTKLLKFLLLFIVDYFEEDQDDFKLAKTDQNSKTH